LSIWIARTEDWHVCRKIRYTLSGKIWTKAAFCKSLFLFHHSFTINKYRYVYCGKLCYKTACRFFPEGSTYQTYQIAYRWTNRSGSSYNQTRKSEGWISLLLHRNMPEYTTMLATAPMKTIKNELKSCWL